ncbi:MAG: phosphate acyltransferase PlsX [Deltaproteobacteria bacterium]|nr:phosphate acyltransferase PlsX [Deltaproteobacteria bacterium]
MELPVAVDAMGGDHGPAPVVAGALEAIRADGARVVLVGDEPTMRQLAGAPELFADHRLAIVHATEVVSMDDQPAMAARKKRDSSMRKACDLVADGLAAAALSPGNSGALMATALLCFGRIEGVLRPAFGTLLPARTSIGCSLLLDAGANPECEPVHLAQWGVLGATYLERAFELERPVVAVISNGEEDIKGTELTRAALALLKKSDVALRGYAEGRDLNRGDVHVFVTDGFTGNVMLKTAEGVFRFVSDEIKRGYQRAGALAKLGGLLSKPMFARMRDELDPREVGAAPLFGLARAAFKAHGSSDAHAIRRGIAAARRYVQHGVDAHLAAAIARNAAAFSG